ncbi:sulfotransferase domain-containing protein [Thiothrix eikelboomii]|uniref:sulfotransferase domain-containing protein n=1 Tax=Thiothrix eikelboomii TaxID=92487 RepID=UPI003BAF0AEE
MQLISAQQQVILTGLPRSGTTLTCHLLNKLPNSVALHEPLIPLDLAGYERAQLVEFILEYFSAQRRQILQTGTAVSKSFGGQVPDNPMAGFDPITGKRIRVLDGRLVEINKPLEPDFCLAIKQPAFFTAILKDLVTTDSLRCFALIRNPLAVLLSWNSVEMPVSRGRVPAAEAFAPELKLSLEQIEDVYDRQVLLLDWFFQQYLTYLPAKQILFYEATINTAGRSLAVINPLANQLTETLYSKNNNSLYNAALKQTLLAKLLSKTEGAFWHFYTEEQLISI